jgi:arylsulfatase A
MNLRGFRRGLLRALLVLAGAACCTGATPAETLPNFILILADDLGWNDVGFCGNRAIRTPHLDQLAREGMVFSQACASAPNCAPTRACLLTGQYPPRHGVYTVVDDRHQPGSSHHRVIASPSRDSLPEASVTLAEALKPAGYATGMFGMWNLGRGRAGPTTPTGQGFDVFTEPKQLGFEKDAYRDARGRYSPDALTDAALSWLATVRDRPFFLYLPFHDVHAPYDPKPELLAACRDREGVRNPAHAATVEAMDANVGRVMQAVATAGLTEKTYVIFTSDNGGTRQDVAPLRGGKGTLYEGGLRVPALIRGPRIRAMGTSTTPILSMDWFPTALELAGLPVPPKARPDGTSLVPILTGKTPPAERDLFWHFPCYVGGSSPCSAIRSGDWKLIEFFESRTHELYNLEHDSGEQHNLATSEPARAAALLARLHAWQQATAAPRPSQPNPAFVAGSGQKPDRPRRNP